MDTEQIEFLKGEFKVMHLEPGDIIVLRHPGVLSEIAENRLLGNVKAILPEHKCVMLLEGMDIGAIHPVELS